MRRQTSLSLTTRSIDDSPIRHTLPAVLGTIAPGKEADLVVLDANPLEDIANLKRIRAVVVRGRLLDRAALDEMLVQVKRVAPARRPAEDGSSSRARSPIGGPAAGGRVIPSLL
jgi:adenine deaminase